MFKHLSVHSVLVTIVALTVACGSKPPDVSGLPRELLVLPGASAIKTGKARDGASELTYEVSGTDFPAIGTIAKIRLHLEALAWTPLTRNWLDPSMPLEWKFARFIDGTKNPNERVHQWDGQWTNGKGEVVSYMLRYRSKLSGDPFIAPDNARIHVVALHLPGEAVKATRQGDTTPLQ